MAIKMLYPPIVIAKIKRILEWSLQAVPVDQDPRFSLPRDRASNLRAAAVQDRIGLQLGYIRGVIGGDFTEPSGRVLKNLGFEVYLKDLETGEMEKIDYLGRCEIDHSDPKNPKRVMEDE